VIEPRGNREPHPPCASETGGNQRSRMGDTYSGGRSVPSLRSEYSSVQSDRSEGECSDVSRGPFTDVLSLIPGGSPPETQIQGEGPMCVDPGDFQNRASSRWLYSLRTYHISNDPLHFGIMRMDDENPGMSRYQPGMVGPQPHLSTRDHPTTLEFHTRALREKIMGSLPCANN
jgi:hypothetical protein